MAPRMTRDPSNDKMPDFAASTFRRQRGKLINDLENDINNDAEAIEHLTELWEEKKARRVATWEAQQLRAAKKAGKQRQAFTAPPTAPTPLSHSSSTPLASPTSSATNSPGPDGDENTFSGNKTLSDGSSEHEHGGSGLGLGLDSIVVDNTLQGSNEPSGSGSAPSQPRNSSSLHVPPITVRKAFPSNTRMSQPSIPLPRPVSPIQDMATSPPPSLNQSTSIPGAVNLSSQRTHSEFHPPTISNLRIPDTLTPAHSKYVDQ